MDFYSDVPDFRLWKWRRSKSFPDLNDVQDNEPWFRLYVGMPEGRFIIMARRSDFAASPALLEQFDMRMVCLPDDGEDPDDTGLWANETAAWVLPSLLNELHELEPTNAPPTEETTLRQFLEKPWFMYRIIAEQDTLRAVGGAPADTPPDLTFWANFRLPSLSCFPNKQIPDRMWYDFHVRAGDPNNVVADQPRIVWMDDQPYTFRSFDGLKVQEILRLICKHERVNDMVSDFYPLTEKDCTIFRASYAQYIVVDEEFRALGLAVNHVHNAMTLREALLTGRDFEYRFLWKKTLVRTLKALHNAGISWDSVTPDSILVRREAAYIYHLGAGPSILTARSLQEDIRKLAVLFADSLWYRGPELGKWGAEQDAGLAAALSQTTMLEF